MIRSVERQLDDVELVRRARAGSLDALGELYRRHGDSMFDAALRLLASHQDAEDVLQDVFVGLPRALQRYEEHGTLAPWLRRIAVRRALMVLRAGRKMQPLASDHPRPDASGDDPTRSIAARDAIASLPDSLRVVFVLKEVEGYAHEEIGTLLGISARASALRLHRAWKILGRRVGEP